MGDRLTVGHAAEAVVACRLLDNLGLFGPNGYDEVFDRIHGRVEVSDWPEVMTMVKGVEHG